MKIRFLFLLLMGFVICGVAHSIELKLKNGKTLQGRIKSYTDTTITLELYKYMTDPYITIPARAITEGIYKKGREYLQVKNGTIISLQKEDKEDIEEMAKQQTPFLKQNINNEYSSYPNLKYKHYNNLNYSLGRLFRSFGILDIAIGGAAVITGMGLLCAYFLDESEGDSFIESPNAGFTLLGVGTSVAIIGIPLVVHGNRMVKMNVSVKTDGVGIGVNF